MRISVRLLLPVLTVSALLVAGSALSATPALAAEGEGCANEQVRQESNVDPSTGRPYSVELLECRAYEMVSPIEKAGDEVQDSVNYASPSPNGEAMSFNSYLGLFAEPEGFEIATSYIARRTSSGWVARSAAVSGEVVPIVSAAGAMLYTPELSAQAACSPQGATGIAVKARAGWQCVMRDFGEPWRLSTPLYPQIGESSEYGVSVVGASNDLSHIVFILKGESYLLPEDTVKGAYGHSVTGLYEIDGAGTANPVLKLVNVNNNGEEIGTTPPHLGNSQLETGIGAIGGSAVGRSLHAISESGSTVYFEATPPGGAQTVYARVDGTYTINISKPSQTDCAECQTTFATQLPAEFQGASADGSIVFFTTEQELLPGATGNELYEYDFAAPAGHRVSLVSRGASAGGVQGVLTSSGDGSHIYFVAQGALTSTENEQGERPVSGADNLYVFQRDEEHPDGQVGFVGKLCTGADLSGVAVDLECPSSSTDSQLWEVPASTGTESGRDQTTPDGRYLIFDTHSHLLPEDVNEAQAVYRYDSQTGRLEWISHGVPGFAALDEGDPAYIPPTTTAGGIFGAHPDFSNRGRAISEAGDEVVFTTKEALSPHDVNHAFDTYLWHEGTVSLISDGRGHAPDEKYTPENSSVLSASGANIYFITTEKLVGQDTDGLADLYDARIGGGFPAPSTSYECASVEAEGERGEACQGKQAASGVFGEPASATFTGGADISSPPATPSTPKTTTPVKKTLTRAQKLSAALNQCRRGKPRSKRGKERRAACEAQARKRYGSRGGSKSKSKATSKGGRGR